ncbi:hypothetical protein Lqui_1932 [Legionella quinlivanii]|uniref:Uncharacterized protein n=1 Tax=Legionella quinlivanii TaxID=45073 RepID=A0A0W0XYL8_9GAMM|nr:hypothetical protein [Legionella quinlivanii]KTD49721.1 hypothetical protein Lqui_1932 [Legionella quinlivanii]SEG23321.1 hypothetical protein SAMN02746093_02258 [Legionella quinlivanii DSM 21216]STY09886.1 Uncharacterised protein [Legionella quinlivanii]
MPEAQQKTTANLSENASSSSITMILQRFRKSEEDKEAAAESAKVRCKTCFKEIAPTPRCFGHGGGGGGGGGAEESSENASSQSLELSLTNLSPLADDEDFLVEFNPIENIDESESDDELFDPEIIAELIEQGLLLVNNDPESMTLTIKLQCDPDTLSEKQRNELKKFMVAIVKEFNSFKNQQHLGGDCIHLVEDTKKNILSLRINLPTRSLYDAFIQQLANNLLPTPRPAAINEKSREEKKGLVSSPLAMEPKPDLKNNDLEQGEERAEEKLTNFNPSPFSIDCKPW